MLKIPQGDWLVVTRPFRDTTSKGLIRKSGLTEQQAKDYAAANRKSLAQIGYHMWAIHKDDY